MYFWSIEVNRKAISKVFPNLHGNYFIDILIRSAYLLRRFKMNTPVYYDQDYRLWAIMTQVRWAIHRLRQLELSKIGVTPEQVALLICAEALGNKATPAEIARWRRRNPNTISSLVNRMVKLGLVTKTNDLKRKDMIRVSLTEKGKKLHDTLTRENSISEVFSVLSDSEKKQLEKTLKILRTKAFIVLGIEFKPAVPIFLDQK
jgi:DNA-binding MarR family transcriptional regulator